MSRTIPHPQESGAQDASTNNGFPTAPQSPHRWLNIQISFADSNRVGNKFFKLGPHTVMRKFMRCACDHIGISEHSSRFLYEGSRLRLDDIPFTVSGHSPILEGAMAPDTLHRLKMKLLVYDAGR
jgi:hypothetical protein